MIIPDSHPSSLIAHCSPLPALPIRIDELLVNKPCVEPRCGRPALLNAARCRPCHIRFCEDMADKLHS